ncbi:hypothetical protein [Cryobacterium psychrotolerans]|uniref:hypothetical protein n=1 Tax=Cryobacterium psychrotolerans TaxID=386301 RepID=UPI0010735B9A|nr:hypothetical protein [Cryobacterium psychrotolerans]TFD85647.1 hypothetical protein E3T56_07890 [Cryobacterium psychrotolerans]
MTRKTIARTAVILGAVGVLAMSLVGCASRAASPAPAIGPSPSASDPAQTDPPAVAAAILVHSDGLRVVDAAGDVLETVTYFDPIADVVAVLTTAIGSDPVVEAHTGGSESSPGTFYVWDGLLLNDTDEPVAAPRLDPEWHVRVDGPTAGTLAVTTAEHVAVGQSQAEVETLVPGTLSTVEVAGSTVMDGRYELLEVGKNGETALHHVTFVRLEGSPLTVTTILAPAPDWGN